MGFHPAGLEPVLEGRRAEDGRTSDRNRAGINQTVGGVGPSAIGRVPEHRTRCLGRQGQVKGSLQKATRLAELGCIHPIGKPAAVGHPRRRGLEEQGLSGAASERHIGFLGRITRSKLAHRKLSFWSEETQVFAIGRQTEAGVQGSARHGSVLARGKHHQKSPTVEVCGRETPLHRVGRVVGQ